MNKIIVIFSTILLLASCGKNEEERINKMIAEATKSSLFIPDSYDPISLTCDSLKTAIINDANIKKASKIIKLVNEANFQREFDSNFEKADSKYTKSLSEAKKLINQLIIDSRKENGFQGYIVDHRFRAKSNVGYVVFGEYIFILDKDKANIVAVYNADSEDFSNFDQMMRLLMEIDKDVPIEEIDIFELCDNIKSRFELQYL